MSEVAARMAFMKDFLLGGVSGSIAKTMTAPLERVKLILQTQPKDSTKYNGMVDCFQKVAKEEGVASFWRGNTANIVRYFPTQALNFAFKERYTNMFVGDTKKTDNFWKYFFGTLAAGGAAGATSMCVVYPLDFARYRMAIDNEKKYNGMADCIKKSYTQGGIGGLYGGFGASVIGIIVYRAAYFGFYDIGKGMLMQPGKKANPLASLALAFTTDTLAGVAAYPFDTVRRRLMVQTGKKEEDKKYKGTLDVFSKVIKEEGVGSFYKGCGSNILRGIGGATCLVIYDNFSGKKKH